MRHRSSIAQGLCACAAALLLAEAVACGTDAPGTTAAMVSLSVSPKTDTIEVGQTTALSALVAGSGSISQAVTWHSSDPTAAAVDSVGVVTGLLASPSVLICARWRVDPTVIGCASVIVKQKIYSLVPPISVVPSSVLLQLGYTRQLTAVQIGQATSASTLTWWSADLTKVGVDSTGLVTGFAETSGVAVCAQLRSDPSVRGCAEIAVFPGLPIPTVFTVTPSGITLYPGDTVRLFANNDRYNGVVETVTWSSSDSTKARVSATGLVTAISSSPPLFVCAWSTLLDSRFGCARVVVSVVYERMSIVPASATLALGESVTFYASLVGQSPGATTFTWSSADTTRVTIDATGRATGRALTPGTAVCARPASHPDWMGCASVIVR